MSALTTVSTSVAALASRIQRTILLGRDESDRPLPQVRMELGRSATAGAFNLGVAALALVCAAQLATTTGHWILAIAGAAAMAVRPLPGMAQIYALVLGAGLALTAYDPWAPRVFLLIFGVHLLVALGSLTQGLPWLARVELQVLLAPARRFAVVQGAAQAVALLGAWVAAQHAHAGWVAVIAGACLAAVAVVLVRSVSRAGNQTIS
jgi:hypothetical protein